MSIRAATTAYFEQYVGLAGGHAESVVIPAPTDARCVQ